LVEEFNSILDKAGESGHDFQISKSELHDQVVDITSAPGDREFTGKLIIGRAKFHKKIDAAMEVFKPKKSRIGFRK
jgi:hypothetical protein